MVSVTETWRPVVGFEGRYEVSDLGRVASLPRHGRRARLIMAQSIDACGYPRLRLCSGGVHTNRRTHNLVADAFFGPRPEGMQVQHLNGDAADCRASNLAWGTGSENTADTIRHGRHRNARKTACERAGHPFNTRNTRIDRDGTRHCRACRAEDARTARAQKKGNVIA